jgi:hypothetical protein
MIVLLLLMTGCHSLVERFRAESLPLADPEPEPAVSKPVEKDVPSASFHCESLRLDLAEEALAQGHADKAFGILSKALNSEEAHNEGFSDRAMAILVRILNEPDGFSEKNTPALGCFSDLATTRPETVFGPASACWLTLVNTAVTQHQEIERLTRTLRRQNQRLKALINQIEQLKAVDLEAVNPEFNEATP